MNNDHNIPGVKIHHIDKSDILSAMAALRVIIEAGEDNGHSMSREKESLSRLEAAMGVGAYSPVVVSQQMQ